jgi:ABC-type bacteriocin/lantibiotic exporter with double-glycine peptidase domain
MFIPPPPAVPAPYALVASSSVADVPFYSQFKNITSPTWQKVGCGVASLAMVIDYYKPAVSVNTLLKQGVAAGAYLPSVGWTYQGLIDLAGRYGLSGEIFDLGSQSATTSFQQLKSRLVEGPVIVSIHYQFDPKSSIPHLVVLDGMSGDTLYYNDPAAKTGRKQISTAYFLKAWKKRFIVIRPEETKNLSVAPARPASLQ